MSSEVQVYRLTCFTRGKSHVSYYTDDDLRELPLILYPHEQKLEFHREWSRMFVTMDEQTRMVHPDRWVCIETGELAKRLLGGNNTEKKFWVIGSWVKIPEEKWRDM